MSSNTQNSDTGVNQEQCQAIYRECVMETYQSRKVSLFAHPIVSILPLYLGWSSEAHWSNLLLVIILLGYTAFLYHLSHKITSSDFSEKEILFWGKNVYFQLAALGLLYNLIFFNLNRFDIDNALLYLLVVTSFFSAGAASSFVHLKNLPIVFIISATTPQIFYYFYSESSEGNILGFLLTTFIFFMWNGSNRIHQNTLKALNLTYKLNAANQRAELLAMTDELTEIKNRRAFFKQSKTLFYAAKRYSHPLTVLMLDIDDFKNINDTYGHAAGDIVIKNVATSLQKDLRESDVSGRIGGEEFAICLPETDLKTGKQLAERIRKNIENLKLDFKNSLLSPTISIGCAEFKEEIESFDELVGHADQALYQAKSHGKNCVKT